ncbi:MAG: Tn3 family transposase [Pseudomonadota bacterium]
MASIEKTAFPVFARHYSPHQLRSNFAVSDDEVAWLKRGARSAGTRLALGLLLKSVQYLGYFPEPEEIPPEIYDHVRSALGFSERVQPDFGSRNTLLGFKRDALIHAQIKRYYGKSAQAIAESIALEAAEVKDFTVDIINAVVEGLMRQNIELPAFSTLDLIAEQAHNQVEQRVIQTIVDRLSPADREKIVGLLDVELNSHISTFNRLKKTAGKATKQHLDHLVSHLTWLESFGGFDVLFEGIVDAKIRYFGNIAKQYDAAALKDYPEDKRLVCVLSLIKLMQVRARDQLGEMFLKRMAKIQSLAKTALEETHYRQRSQVEGLVVTLGGVVQIIVEEPNDEVAGKKIREYVTAERTLAEIQAQVEEVKTYGGTNYLPLLWDQFISQRSILFRLIHLLRLEATSHDIALIKAIEIIKAHQHKTSEWLKTDIDLSFASSRWRQLVRQESGSGLEVNRRLFEVCVFMHIAYALRSGDLAISDSEEFSDYRKDLMPWEECEKLLPEYCERIGIPSTAKEFRNWLEKELSDEAAKLDAQFPDHSSDVTLASDGRPSVRRAEARPIPESAIQLREEIIRRMPARHVVDCLENVQHWLNFTRNFGPITGNEAKLDDPATRYVMTVFAMGCNLGPTQAARHFQDSKVSAHMLSMVNRRHISLEMLERAQRELNEVYLQLDLPKMWGEGKTVAADGTQYDFFDDNLLVGMHFRYRKTGSVAYRLVTDNYIAVFRHFIGPGIWEAVYVLEGLMKAGLSVEPDTIHSDTQGQSASVFTYALLYGVKLMPRIRNWKDLKLFRPSASTTYEHINKLFSEVADWDLIEGGWKEVMQVAMSIASGKISSARLLRKLSSYSRRNKLYFAAQAMGEVIRTLYLLRWIGSRELRQEVTANTNKMESYNGFSKWSGFGGDVINSNDPDEQQKRLRYIDLVASCIILQNTVDMTKIINELKTMRTISNEDLNFLSPYLTEHILRFGKYRVRLNRPKESWIVDPTFEDAAAKARRLGKPRK